MKTYEFTLDLVLFHEHEKRVHIVQAISYRKAKIQLLKEVPIKYAYDRFAIHRSYKVNGKKRIAK